MQMTICKDLAICIWAFMFVIHWNLRNRSTALTENACANPVEKEQLEECSNILRRLKGCITEGRNTDAFWVVHKTTASPVSNDLERIKALASDVELELLFQSSSCPKFIWVIITVESNVIIILVFLLFYSPQKSVLIFIFSGCTAQNSPSSLNVWKKVP